jgi:hypothetical protein
MLVSRQANVFNINLLFDDRQLVVRQDVSCLMLADADDPYLIVGIKVLLLFV